DYIRNKQPDVCPPENMVAQADVDLDSEEVQATFRDLIANDVVVTSTLSVYETFVPGRSADDPRVLEALSPDALEEVMRWRKDLSERRASLVVLPVLFEKMKK